MTAPNLLPAQTPQSRALSKALKAAGWRFVGQTTVYAFMQAMGMVNDHHAAAIFALAPKPCAPGWRHRETAASPSRRLPLLRAPPLSLTPTLVKRSGVDLPGKSGEPDV